MQKGFNEAVIETLAGNDELTDMMSQAEKFPGLINKIIPTDLF